MSLGSALFGLSCVLLVVPSGLRAQPSLEPPPGAGLDALRALPEETPQQTTEAEIELGHEEAMFCGGETDGELGRAYLDIEDGRPQAAVRRLRRALYAGRIERWNRPVAWTMIGDAYVKLGRHAAAVAAYRRALRADPDLAATPVALGLSVALAALGRREQSMSEAQKLVSLCETEPVDYGACYGAYALLGRLEQDPDAMLVAMANAFALRLAHAEPLAAFFDDIDAQLDEALGGRVAVWGDVGSNRPADGGVSSSNATRLD
ncbi:MAG: tetratricopeptide repeat protein [Myxococcales bacterium]|nr:tetratricopeptide repeat protein [Myxococcales bacterium]